MSFKADSAEAIKGYLKEKINKIEKPDFEDDVNYPDLEQIKGKVY